MRQDTLRGTQRSHNLILHRHCCICVPTGMTQKGSDSDLKKDRTDLYQFRKSNITEAKHCKDIDRQKSGRKQSTWIWGFWVFKTHVLRFVFKNT
eukprot:5593773-Amphidinium_carterae.1